MLCTRVFRSREIVSERFWSTDAKPTNEMVLPSGEAWGRVVKWISG